MHSRGVTPEVSRIAERVFAQESDAVSLYLSLDELEAANERTAQRLNIDVDRVQLILSYGPDE